MKRLLCVVATVAFVAVLSTSCDKTCTCKTYLNDVVVTTSEIELNEGGHCSDFNTVISTPAGETGVKCR